MKEYDAIIIGAGHNGLVCAAYLAKAGQRVLVLEASTVPGGLAADREFHPGFRTPIAHSVSHFAQKIADDLAKWRESVVTTLLIQGDPELLRTAAELVLHG